jgi:hypothetical protein
LDFLPFAKRKKWANCWDEVKYCSGNHQLGNGEQDGQTGPTQLNQEQQCGNHSRMPDKPSTNGPIAKINYGITGFSQSVPLFFEVPYRWS